MSDSLFHTYAADRVQASAKESGRIGTRHTIKLCAGRSIAVQATKTGSVLVEIIDRTGAAASIDAMSLDPATAGALAFSIEQCGEAIEADRARRLRLAHELQRAAA